MNLRLKWYFFHSGLTFKKVIARLEATQKKVIFQWLRTHMLTQEIPECPFPTLPWNGQLKKYAELFEKKVRVMVEEVGGWVCFLQSWFEGGRAKISTMAPGAVTRGGRLLPNLVPMFNKNEEKG